MAVLGNTALAIAAQRGHLNVVKRLIEKGADVRKANRQGKTALEVAKDDEVRAALTGTVQKP